MKKLALLLTLAFISSAASAETVLPYKGSIACDKFELSKDYVLFKPGKEKTEYSSKKPVLSLCQEKDSEEHCTCYVPYLDEKAYSDTEHNYQVLTTNNEKIWVIVPVKLEDTKRF